MLETIITNTENGSSCTLTEESKAGLAAMSEDMLVGALAGLCEYRINVLYNIVGQGPVCSAVDFMEFITKVRYLCLQLAHRRIDKMDKEVPTENG